MKVSRWRNADLTVCLLSGVKQTRQIYEYTLYAKG